MADAKPEGGAWRLLRPNAPSLGAMTVLMLTEAWSNNMLSKLYSQPGSSARDDLSTAISFSLTECVERPNASSPPRASRRASRTTATRLSLSLSRHRGSSLARRAVGSNGAILSLTPDVLACA